jgi:3',5'-cyclic AMP phosphodiesterase CpdA
MRITFISDTHNKHKQVKLPECDIAIFAGDATSVGHKHEVESFLKWYSKQDQCKHKIFIAGNHDRSFDVKFFYRYEDFDDKRSVLF